MYSGSIGGAIIMNSGCYDNDISKILISIKAIDRNNFSEVEIKREDIKICIETNLSKDLIIVSAKFKGLLSVKDEIEKKQLSYKERKKPLNKSN